MTNYNLPHLVAAQHGYHAHDVLWQCGCAPAHSPEHGCLAIGYRHTEPFHACPECAANFWLNGLTGGAVVRAMREFTEVWR